MAEILGRTEGCTGGLGGSMHLSNRDVGLLPTFAIVGAGVPIAAGLLYPTFGVLLSPMIAAAAMALSSVSVIGNALRLRTIKV